MLGKRRVWLSRRQGEARTIEGQYLNIRIDVEDV